MYKVKATSIEENGVVLTRGPSIMHALNKFSYHSTLNLVTLEIMIKGRVMAEKFRIARILILTLKKQS